MSTLNSTIYQRSLAESVRSESIVPERRNGYLTPQPTMNYLDVPRPAPRAAPRSRSPRLSGSGPPSEVSAVDPTLEDAQKAGDRYNITMSLNAALAGAGLSPSIAMATGRTSQMDYMASNASLNSSRMDHHMGPPRGASPRPGSVSVVQVTGNPGFITPAPPPYHHMTGRTGGSSGTLLITASTAVPHQEHIAVNEAYTIKSVTPSESRAEIHTTVQRPPGSERVGFDLQLIGGQTTTVTKTVSDVRRNENGTGGGNVASMIRSTTTNVVRPEPTRIVNVTETVERKDRSHGRNDRVPVNRRTIVTREHPDYDILDGSEFTSVDKRSGGRPPKGMVAGGQRSDARGTRGEREPESDMELFVHSSSQQKTDYDSNPWIGQDVPTEVDASLAIYRRLAKGAPPGSVRQWVDFDKEEEEILKSKPGAISSDLLNVDTVSEKVNVRVGDGVAEMTVKVRTERIVPIQGSEDLFRKSAVTVNRIIEVDMMATEERQRIYDGALRKQRSTGQDLSQKDTFDLYKAFLRLAEEDEGFDRQQVRIDKTTDEARLPDLQRSAEVAVESYGRQGGAGGAGSSYGRQVGAGGGGGGYASQQMGFDDSESEEVRVNRTTTTTSRSTRSYAGGRDAGRTGRHYGNPEDSEVSSALY